MYKVEILADSISPFGQRITTMKVTFPRIILAEFNTHRMFSRNSASSRAIPFEKMVKMVEENPFIPIAFQEDHKGMQGSTYLSGADATYARACWMTAKIKAVNAAKVLNKAGVTKQLCNRLLEPFMWHTVIVTSTDWNNFFNLRCPVYDIKGVDIFSPTTIGKTFEEMLDKDLSSAEIHIQKLAHMMFDEYNASTPNFLYDGQWHIPFGDNIKGNFNKDEKLKIASARCARISYETLGDSPKIDHNADLRLADSLLSSRHASPFEHVARVRKGRYGNLNGFESYRTILESEGSL